MADVLDVTKKRNRIDSSSEEENEEEEFSVEKILAKKERRGKTLYLLKWHNYPDSEATWEPSEHCNCPELIAKYEDEQFRKKFGTINENSAKNVKEISTPLAPPVVVKGEVETNTQKQNATKLNEDCSESKNDEKAAGKKMKIEEKQSKTVVNGISPMSLDEDRKESNTQQEIPSKLIEQHSESKNNEVKSVAERAKIAQVVESSLKTGFDLGLQPRKVLGMFRSADYKTFQVLVAWEDDDKDPDIIPSSVANEKCPQLIIQYYERHLKWKKVGALDLKEQNNNEQEK